MVPYSAAHSPDKFFIIHVARVLFFHYLDELHSKERTSQVQEIHKLHVFILSVSLLMKYTGDSDMALTSS